GAVALALRLGIPALIVGLTVVAFGTSAPELLVSIQAVTGGAPGIALGNVVGSNIANVLLVIGLPAMISVLHTSRLDTAQSYVTMLVASAIFIALAFTGTFRWWAGLGLLAVLGGMLWQSYAHAAEHRATNSRGAEGNPPKPGKAAEVLAEGAVAEPEERGAGEVVAAVVEKVPGTPGWKIAVLLLVGLSGLPVGAHLLVEGAVDIARLLGVSEAIIGLTLVALGTSLPELATTVTAALRKSADVALGNVIGSCLFNLTGIVGITALVAPVPVDPEFLRFDLWVMLGTSLLLAPFIFKQRDIGFWTGALFVSGYVAYVVALLA
ncbi:MAG: calcium/sodium antiporter, partial [Paracoccaceae bacterium]|nr:calcium/sodium antiporter [Paracoccaceae bacterium]